MVTSREVARMAGVSQATVSRVLRNTDTVSEGTRRRVTAALVATGYQPNLAARAMRTRRTGTIGVILADLFNPFYPEILQSISRSLASRQLRMVVWDSEGPGEQGAIDAVDQRLVDGLIFTTATPDSAALKAAVGRRAPVVLVNRTVDGLGCDQVESNNAATGDVIARYLAAHGHRRAGLITAGVNASTARDRAAGFLAGAAAVGLDVGRRHIVDGGFSHAGGAAGMQTLLRLTQPPTAVFCVNDLSALGAIDGARSAGVEVPRDVWVVGYDDIDLASWASYGLTTARQPLDHMSEAAAELLATRLDDPHAEPVRRRFVSELIVRTSTAGAAP